MKKYLLFICFFSVFYCKKAEYIESSKESILNNSISNDIVTLDPHKTFDITSHKVSRQIFESLVEYSLESLELESRLAESWEFTDEGRKLVFRLRDDVYFHDDPCFPEGKGRNVTAEDVKYSFERNYSENSTGVQFLSSLKGFNGKNLPDTPSSLEGIKVLDKYTIQFEFEEPNSTFLPSLNRSFGYVVPKEAIEYYGENFKYHPVGTGPFKFYRLENNGDIILKKNQNYWKKDKFGNQLPYLDGVIYKLIKTPILRLMKFTNKELDILNVSGNNFAVIFKDTSLILNDFYREMGCKIVSSPYSFSTSWLLFSTLGYFRESKADISNVKKIWKSVNLRRALNYSIDRESIVNDILGSWQAFTAKGEFPPGMSTYDKSKKGYYYDPKLARLLLQKAGYPGGKGLKKFKIVIPEGIKRSQIGKYIKNNLKDIGIESEIYMVPYSEKTDFVQNIGAELHFDRWTLDYPDPMNFFEPSSVDVSEEFAKQIFFEINPVKRKLLLQKWEEIMLGKSIKIYLFHSKDPVKIVQKNIENYFACPMLYEDLTFVRKK